MDQFKFWRFCTTNIAVMKKNIFIILGVLSIPVIIYLVVIYFWFKTPTPMKVYEFDVPKSEILYQTEKFKEMNIYKYPHKELNYQLDESYIKEVIEIGQNTYIYVVYDFEKIQLLGWHDSQDGYETTDPDNLYSHPQEVALFEKEVIEKIRKIK